MAQTKEKLGFSQAWSMAVGGMVSGEIFATLGVVIMVAGPYAWFSFLVGGLVALAVGYSYVKLASRYGEGGGAFTFLQKVNAKRTAASAAWVLIVGYVITTAVYAFTFGQYVGYLAGLGMWFPRFCAVAVIGVFVFLNLQGVREAGGIQVAIVAFQLVVLLALAGWGLWAWEPQMLSRGVESVGLGAAVFGAASIFIAYEGFQLLAYDYEDVESPDRTLPAALLSAIVTVIVIYILVAVGTVMLIGADTVIANKEVALSLAGFEIAGMAGLVVVTLGAAFSTGGGINATLFATARLARRVALEGQLPKALARTNSEGIPDRALVFLGVVSAVLAAIGSLSSLVESASLVFLLTFSCVSGIAFHEKAGNRFLTATGFLAALSFAVALIVRLVYHDPVSLAILIVFILAAVILRPYVLKKTVTREESAG